MAALYSTQETNRRAGSKNLPNTTTGKHRSAYGRYVYAAAGAIADTIDFCIVPKGARITQIGIVSCSTGTASATMDVGLKSLKTGTPIDADGIAVAVNIASAGQKSASNGALIANGAEYITTEDVVVYGTIAGATPPSGQAIVVDVPYVTD
jgi:hypothetical protein